MKVSASFLSINDDLEKNIIKLDKTTIDYLHLDIMDGKFVKNKTWDIKNIKKLLKNTQKPKDVHLMVSNIKKYVKQFRKLKPEYITFHYEATKNCFAMMGLIKKYGIKVGISIKPNTPVEKLNPYFKYLNLILVMSVEPGEGGQEFIPETIDKIKQLDVIRKANKYQYLIEVDGGINNQNINLLRENNVDIVVAGSYITSIKGYQRRVDKLKADITKQ
ncbi:MAG: ribulose-phosphate 3-epimerase [Firmicutes bacterium]|nr:ribulose-phosphate 3-epimerase [Bacillota bacterium]